MDNDFDYAWKVYSEAVKPHIAPLLKRGWEDHVEVDNFRKVWSLPTSHIITLDQIPVGWIGVLISGDHVEIEHLYIDSSFRGRGIGSRLVSELIKQWNQEGKAVKANELRDPRVSRFASRLGLVAAGSDSDGAVTRAFVYRHD
jgi:GNAT superfamily N-acetyltransferase